MITKLMDTLVRYTDSEIADALIGLGVEQGVSDALAAHLAMGKTEEEIEAASEPVLSNGETPRQNPAGGSPQVTQKDAL